MEFIHGTDELIILQINSVCARISMIIVTMMTMTIIFHYTSSLNNQKIIPSDTKYLCKRELLEISMTPIIAKHLQY